MNTCIYVSLHTHTHTHTHTHPYLHTCTHIMHTYPEGNSAWVDNLSSSKCLQQATVYQHQAWVPAAPELCQYLHFLSMSKTSKAHLEWEVWLRLPLRGSDWRGCQGYSGAVMLCLLIGNQVLVTWVCFHCVKLCFHSLCTFLYAVINVNEEVRCCCSGTQLHPTLCDPMDCSTPGFPVLHHLPELALTHVHRVRDAIQPSHPLSSPSPPAFNLSQHQGLF